MKTIVILIGVLVLAGIAFQGWVMYSSNVEEQPYNLLETYGEVEIRFYPPARMASVTMDASGNTSNSGFRMLAGYIFGGNAESKEYAMTAPVHMSQDGNESTMSFVLPEESWNDSLPSPNDNRVNLHWSESETVAAIRFPGYMDQANYSAHKTILTGTLDSLGISYFGEFKRLGYDPPYKVTDRRNEILVKIDPETLP